MKKSSHSVELISGFPDFKARGFDMDEYNQQFKDKNSIISARSKNIAYDKHWGCLSLKFSLGGNEYYQTGNSTYAVNDSNFLILNQDTEYSSYIDAEKEVESFTLNFSEKFTTSYFAGFDKQLPAPRFVERLYTKDNALYPLAAKIYHCLGDFHQRNDEVAELFVELFGALLKHHAGITTEVERISKIKPSTRQELYKRLNYARDFIDSCYQEDINLDSISAIACLNREYFIRQFKSHFKTTPAQYLIRRRMDAARQLLLTSEMDISEVCEQVGYSDLSSFGKLFRRYYSVSPTEMRKC